MSLSDPVHPPSALPAPPPQLLFVGGGNMARAIIGGLRASLDAHAFTVLEPDAVARAALERDFGVRCVAPHEAKNLAKDLAHPQHADVVVWAVKPQAFAQAAAMLAGQGEQALHLSVMAGVRSASIAHATNAQRVVRAMPNTPALIGRGIAGLVATAHVTPGDRALVERVIAPTGQWLWLQDEAQLDAVTAVSGSGPAYVFYFLEAMTAAGVRQGLSMAHAQQLAVATAQGAAELAARSTESLAQLRERVTSKGGTTHAALTVLAQRQVAQSIDAAIEAATRRARELGEASSGG
jgi:pyrroline-5-carboxylate reductase